MEHGKRRKHAATTTSTWTRTTSFQDLPEDIIQRIQFFLPYEQALRSSLLCNSWLRAWSTFPALWFQIDPTEEDRVKFVDHTLDRYLHENLLIHKLNLSFNSWKHKKITNNIFDSRLSKWLQIAGQSGLKELTISLPEEPFLENLEEEFNLRLLSLNLTNRNYNHKIDFGSLRVLELSNIWFEQQVIDQLLSSCTTIFPVIEKVGILYCNGFERIKLDSLGCLVEFKLMISLRHVMVDIIDCPRLASFVYMVEYEYEWPVWDFSIIDSSSSNSCKNLRSLSFDGICPDEVAFSKLISKLPCLEKLCVKRGLFFNTIDISSASLIELSFQDCRSLDLKLNAPKLCLIDYNGDGYISASLSYDPNMKTLDQLKAKLCFTWTSSYPPPFTPFFLGLKKLIDISRTVDIHLSYNFLWDLKPRINFHALRSSITPIPSWNIKQVSLDTTCVATRYILTILDAFLMVCHPKHIRLRMGISGHKIFDFFSNQRPSCCCTDNINKCWRHYLQEVEIWSRKKLDEEYKWWLLTVPFPWEKLVDGSDPGFDGRICFRLKWLA